MGEQVNSTLFRPDFNKAVRVDASRTALTADAGAILLREVADRLGLPAALSRVVDHRRQDLITHPCVELLMTRVLLLAQGWRDQDDADKLRHDPALRLAVSTRRGTAPLTVPKAPFTPNGLPSQPTLSRMQGMIGGHYNRFLLSAALAERACARVLGATGYRAEATWDIDSYARPAHGKQEGVRYNGHYHMECLHPLVAYTDTGDMLAVRLRPGNVHTAADIRSFLTPLLPRVRKLAKKVWLRMDCGYSGGKLLAWLDQRHVTFITRLANNPALKGKVKAWYDNTLADWKEGPAGEGRTRQAMREFWHRVPGGTKQLRVVAVLVERDYAHGELLHNVFFLATNASRAEGTTAQILRRYRDRGIAEQRIGEFLTDIAAPVSSVPRFRHGSVARKRPVGAGDNEASLILAAFAYNILHALRSEMVLAMGELISIRGLRESVLKAAATVTRHARQVIVRITGVKAEIWTTATRALPPIVAAEEDVPA